VTSGNIDVHRSAADGFERGAATYARGRPGYPPQALAWLREDLDLRTGRTVLELGAGTGIFTQLLSQTGAEIIAADPVVGMLAQLAAKLPGVRTLRANAQELPLAPASVDAVVCAQSFHWFATVAALSEIRRVLKAGGSLGLVWNVRDRSVPWVDVLARIVDRHEGDAPRYDAGEWRRVFPAAGFGPMSERTSVNVHTGTAEQVIVDRVASVSFIAALPDSDRRVVLDEVRALIAATPDLADASAVNMPYLTKMFWCRKTGS